MTYWNGSAWEADPVADPPRPRRARRFLGAATEAGLITLLMFGLIAGTALAAKGGGKPAGKTQSSLSLVVVDAPDANWGETVTFEVSTTATSQPMVEVNCLQSGTLVYWASAGFYDSYPWQWARNFSLKSTYWSAGGAECTATLYLHDGRRYRDLASIAFTVYD